MRSILFFSLTLASAAALAQMPQGGPPQEAISACSGHSEGASCSFSSPRGDNISGTCDDTPDGMACVPEGGPQGMPGQGRQMGGGQNGQRRGPPQEAISACSGQSEQASCSFTTPRGDEVSGSCRNTPDGMACAPAGGPQGMRGQDGAMGRMQ